MPAPSPARALRTAIETGALEPVYYLYGEDDFRKDEAVRQLTDKAVDPATRDFNLEVRRASEVDAETLGSLLGTPPMMADRRVVVIREVGALRKDSRAVLDRYLASPASDLVLVLTSPAGTKVDKALAEKTTAVEIEALTGVQLPKWITRYVETTFGTTITPEAIELLLDAVGSDLAALRLELDKLGSSAKELPIDDARVSDVVGVRKEETLAGFLDAVAARDVVRSMALLPEILRQPKNGGVPVVMALGTQVMAIGFAQALRQQGMHPGRIDGELFNLLKSGGSVMTGRSWGDAVRCWSRASTQWTAAQVDHALDALLAADLSLKSGGVSSEDQVLATLVLSICGDPARRAA